MTMKFVPNKGHEIDPLFQRGQVSPLRQEIIYSTKTFRQNFLMFAHF